VDGDFPRHSSVASDQPRWRYQGDDAIAGNHRTEMPGSNSGTNLSVGRSCVEPLAARYPINTPDRSGAPGPRCGVSPGSTVLSMEPRFHWVGRGFFHPVPAASPFCPARGELVRTNHPPILPAVIDRIRCFDNPSIPPRGQSGHVGFGFLPGGKPQAIANPLTGLSSCLRCPGHHSSFHGLGIMGRNLFPLAAAGEGTTPGVGLGPMPTRCRTTLGDLEARGVREGSGEGV